MIEIRKTDGFAAWLDGLRDMQARLRVLVRIERLAGGNPGDVTPICEGLSELRIDYGPGYRVYFTHRGSELVILLAGGSKSSQPKDIQTALALARLL
jgi:putative addiction module killer protein